MGHSRIHISLMNNLPFCLLQVLLKMQSLDSNGLINTSFGIGKSYILGRGRGVGGGGDYTEEGHIENNFY